MTESEIFEKYDDFSENELKAKKAKKFVQKMMLWLLLLNAAQVKKKEAKEK